MAHLMRDASISATAVAALPPNGVQCDTPRNDQERKAGRSSQNAPDHASAAVLVLRRRRGKLSADCDAVQISRTEYTAASVGEIRVQHGCQHYLFLSLELLREFPH